MNPGPVYLVDASIYIFRAWYSVPDEFTTASGEPTNGHARGINVKLRSILERICEGSCHVIERGLHAVGQQTVVCWR